MGLLVLAVAAFGFSEPRILAFAAPVMTQPGTTVQLQYAAAGRGVLSYTVVAPNGSQLSGGALSQRSGSIGVAIPTSNEPRAYTMQLTMRGPLGSAKEIRVLNAVPPRNGGAQIRDISVNPVVATPGQTVTVSYSASAGDGFVRLLDRDGTVWAQRPFSRGGLTTFVLPPVSENREMRVVLHVTKGRTFAESSAGLMIARATGPHSASADPASALAGSNDPGRCVVSGQRRQRHVCRRSAPRSKRRRDQRSNSVAAQRYAYRLDRSTVA